MAANGRTKHPGARLEEEALPGAEEIVYGVHHDGAEFFDRGLSERTTDGERDNADDEHRSSCTRTLVARGTDSSDNASFTRSCIAACFSTYSLWCINP